MQAVLGKPRKCALSILLRYMVAFTVQFMHSYLCTQNQLQSMTSGREDADLQHILDLQIFCTRKAADAD